jgi:hypothetical protein
VGLYSPIKCEGATSARLERTLSGAGSMSCWIGTHRERSVPIRIAFSYFDRDLKCCAKDPAMFEVISANAIFVWFVWGIFMAMGWALGTWIMGRLLGFMKF